MPQEDNEKSWFEGFRQSMNTIFTKKDFNNYRRWVELELPIYKEFVKSNARILDIGCGLGCMAVPLSTLGYEITGIDNDPDVVKAAKQNAEKFGRKIEIIKADIFDIDKLFQKDSFDACISGGVLEHFPEDEIRQIIDKQLKLAPIVIASMPIALKNNVQEEYKNYDKRICKDGIYRNMWTADHWTDVILKDYNILKKHVGKAADCIGGFDEIIVVIGRNNSKAK